MSFEIKDRLIKGIAFEKVVIKVLQLDNQNLRTEYIEKFNDYKIRRYDAFIEKSIKLNQFNMDTIYANKIYIEIKYGRVNSKMIDQLYKSIDNEESSHLIVFMWGKKSGQSVKHIEGHSNLTIIDRDDMTHNSEIYNFFKDFEDYIGDDNSIIIDDFYDELKSISGNISFALGAGCSINSNISDWNQLSSALGYDLLYNVVYSKDSPYKNMMITSKLNYQIFSNFEKNSALDAIYHSYANTPGFSKLDYFKAIKNVLYMSFDNPKDANNALLKSINDCIIRNNIDQIINYNFDCILELNHNNAYKSSSKEVFKSQVSIGKCLVNHVHGYIPCDYDGKTMVENFVFTDKEYYENMLDKINFCNTTQDYIFNNYNVFFVGISFTDSNMKERLRDRKTKNFTNSIYGFLKLPQFKGKGTEIDVMRNKYKLIQQSYFDSLGVKILWVDDYDEIPMRINSI